MASAAQEIVICVDMGMTGSVARWRHSQSTEGWKIASDSKIPTKLAYDLQDNDGPPIAWGLQCEELPSVQIKECFKAFIPATSFSDVPDAVPWGPSSQRELHRWVRDYLSALCAEVAATINERTTLGWRDVTVIWNFSVPGSWAVLPVVADFKRLAEEASSSCFQNAKDFRVCTDVTEATASAQCLLVEGSVLKEEEHRVGNTIISCDIGGATTDVAISTISSAGRLTTWPKLKTESAGTVTIEKAFWLHASHTLRSAGAQNPEQLALEMVRGLNFRRARVEFTKGQSKEHVRIRLPNSSNVSNWSPPETKNTRLSIIENEALYIHRDVFESFFTQFVQQIEAAIDETIITATNERIEPTILGFCGGGSRTLYAMERLRGRYGDSISIIDYTQLSIKPEMATVIGSTLIWDQKKLDKFIIQTSFGIETDDGIIRWTRAEKSLASSKFSRAYPWVVKFACSKSRSFGTHKIIARTSTPPLPNNFPDGESGVRNPSSQPTPHALNSRSWNILVDLQKENGGRLSRKRKYQVVCNIAGPEDIDFRAESLVSGKDIPCTVLTPGEGSHE